MGVLNGDFSPDADAGGEKSEIMKQLEELTGEPQGANTNLNFITDPTIQDGARNADGDAPCIGIGVPTWLSNYYQTLDDSTVYMRGLTIVGKKIYQSIYTYYKYRCTIGIDEYTDVIPNKFSRQVYGILISKVEDQYTATSFLNYLTTRLEIIVTRKHFSQK